MYSDKITFVIFTFNEQSRIARAVRNFYPFGRVLVVDNLSTDSTREIAVGLGASVLEHRNPGWVENEDTVSVVKAAVQTPWIYWGYADEILDNATLDELIATIEAGRHAIVNIARKNYYYGVFTHDAYLNTLNRAFLKDAVDFKGNKIHGFGRPTVAQSAIHALDSTKYFVHHFISNDAKAYLRTIDSYTDIQARKTEAKGPVGLLARVLKGFFIHYVLGRGFKAGMPGLFMCLQMTYYTFLLHMKAYEISEGLSVATIEQKNDVFRDVILKTLTDQQGRQS